MFEMQYGQTRRKHTHIEVKSKKMTTVAVPCVSLFYARRINRFVGIPYHLPLASDAGYAVLLLTLLGAPVSIGRALGGLMA